MKKRTLVLFSRALALGISRTVPGNADTLATNGNATAADGGLFK